MMVNSRLVSTAVMARRAEPADSLDYFPTPPWATRAFCKHVLPIAWPLPNMFKCVALDPACGEGHMAVALQESFQAVLSADIFDYGFGGVADFLHPGNEATADWIITNPPFNLAIEFVMAALKRARRGVAMLCRTQFTEGQDRYARLFAPKPPQIVAQYVERVPMHKGRWVINGKTATAYEWFVWLVNVPHDWQHTRRFWIPPSRVALSRHDDWERFGACVDLPKDHAAMVRQAHQQPYQAPALTLAAVREKMALRQAQDEVREAASTGSARKPATLADIRADLEGRLL